MAFLHQATRVAAEPRRDQIRSRRMVRSSTTRRTAIETAKWRYSARRAAAEFGVIVAGVLVALAVDEWRQSLRDRAAEIQYIERLIEDVRADTAELSGALGRGREKEVRLQRLMRLSERDLTDARGLALAAEDLDRSQGWGWEYPSARRVTFDELLSIGALGLIADVQVRDAISDYYWWHEDTEDRVEARRSGFPRMAYTLVHDVASETPADPSNGSGGVTASAAGLREAIRSGELHRASRAELNFTRYQMAVTEGLIEIAGELITLLESYLADPRN